MTCEVKQDISLIKAEKKKDEGNLKHRKLEEIKT